LVFWWVIPKEKPVSTLLTLCLRTFVNGSTIKSLKAIFAFLKIGAPKTINMTDCLMISGPFLLSDRHFYQQYGGFLKWGYPQNHPFSSDFPSIFLGYLHLWKPMAVPPVGAPMARHCHRATGRRIHLAQSFGSGRRTGTALCAAPHGCGDQRACGHPTETIVSVSMVDTGDLLFCGLLDSQVHGKFIDEQVVFH